MAKKQKKLPKKLSALIRLALADMKAARRAGLKLHMSWWVAPGLGTDKQCSVCMAGAVMYGTLGNVKGYVSDPSDVTDDRTEQRKLRALNNVRIGDLRGALLCMEKWDDLSASKRAAVGELGEYLTVHPMRTAAGLELEDPKHRRTFYRAMNHVAKKLEDLGL